MITLIAEFILETENSSIKTRLNINLTMERISYLRLLQIRAGY